MIAASLIALAVQQVVPTDVERAHEVTVIGRRLGDWRGTVRLRGGNGSCRTRKSSGDQRIDAMACGVMEACVREARPRMDAFAASKPPRAELKRIQSGLNRDMGACLKAGYERGTEQLAEQRLVEQRD